LRKAEHKGTFKTRFDASRQAAAALHGKEPMKITCQACQAKYTIADEKIQGKIAKIRCRKCGATVLVDASGASSPKAESTPAAASDSWLVSVAEGDQRTMTTQDVVQAFGSSVVTGDTYVWKEGMTDWQPLADMSELMTAIQVGSTSVAVTPSSPPEPEFAPVPAAAAAPIAARREPGRIGGADLFAGGAVEDEVATSAPSHMLARGGNGSAVSSDLTNANQAGLTGARDEHSVLFSLSALTGGTKEAAAPVAIMPGVAAPPPRNEDSGLIDLNALAQAQRARLPQAADALAAAPSPFAFPAALGTVEVPRAEAGPKSRMPMFIGGGICLAGIIAAVVILGSGHKEEAPSTAASGAVSAAAVEPSVSAAASAAPAASGSSEAASAADSASGNRPVRKVVTGPRPPTRVAPLGAPAQPVPAALPPPKKSPCGCATGDLQCQIRCSAMGH
jgi:predicted Zn finger-like uncharacterized protein